MKYALIGALLLCMVMGLAACGVTITAPELNRVDVEESERAIFWNHGLWFPMDVIEEKEDEINLLTNSALTALFERVNEWIVQEETQVGSFSVEIINATAIDYESGIDLIAPSGARIRYSAYPEPVRNDCADQMTEDLLGLLEGEGWIFMSRLIFIPNDGNDLEALFEKENAVLGILDCRTTHVHASVINKGKMVLDAEGSPILPISGSLIVYSLR